MARAQVWPALAVALGIGCLISDGAVQATTLGTKYTAAGRCGPFPRAQVTTPGGMCLGIVAGPEQGIRWPRNVLEIAAGVLIVADPQGWGSRGRGRVLRLRVAADGSARSEILFANRNLPHGLAMGRDGRVYVGDEDAIWRFDPEAADPVAEVVKAGILTAHGGNHLHPLKQIVFDLDGNLVVNMGAPNDSCRTAPGAAAPWPLPCPLVESARPDAALWRLSLAWAGRGPGQPGAFEPLARGLRNSMALAVHPVSGLLVQAENGIDSWDGGRHPDLPPEEINVILPGRHYGWPYCSGAGTPLPAYARKGVTCARYEAPAVLMPAHAAPLAMAYYRGAMFPQLTDKLLVALHGYDASGHRLVAYDTDPAGRPLPPRSRGVRPGLPTAVIDEWVAPGVSPRGSPAGLAVGRDGRIWLVDDKAAAVLVLLRDDAATRAPPPRSPPVASQASPIAAPAGWDALYAGLLRERCQACHEEFRPTDARAAWARLAARDLVDASNLRGSRLFQSMLAEGTTRPMPPPRGLEDADRTLLVRFLAGLPRN